MKDASDILDGIEVNGTSNCFRTFKDHKTNLINYPTDDP